MLDDCILGIWPRFPDGKGYLEIRIVQQFDDLDAVGDTLAMPVHMYETLVYSLAVRLAPDYKLPLQERMLLKQEADSLSEAAFAHLSEGASIFMQPRIM